MKNSFFKESIVPVIVLVCICLVASFALAFTYNTTLPTITAAQEKTANEAKQLVLPDADSFDKYSGKLNEGVTAVDMAKNGCGLVVTATPKSFGGNLEMMVGIDKDGKVTKVTVLSNSDTPGLGDKSFTDEHLGQYAGVNELAADQVKKDSSIQEITGASITSNAVYQGVKNALAQFEACGGVK